MLSRRLIFRIHSDWCFVRMKVFSIDCFAKNEEQESRELLSRFLSGVEAGGGEVERIRVSESNILECRHCFDNPDFHTPGVCLQDDDMNRLYPVLKSSDVWVFAFDYNISSPNFAINNLIDRLEPLFPDNPEEQTKQTNSKIVLLSTCSCWDAGTFEPVVDRFKDLAAIAGREFAGAMLRPDFGKSEFGIDYGHAIDKVYDTSEFLGRELAQSGTLPEKKLEEFSACIKKRRKMQFSEN